jgi:hypothetical protein
MKQKALALVFLIVFLLLAFNPSNFMGRVNAQEIKGFGNATVPEIATINWTRFWQLFNAHTDWNLEYNSGSGWVNIKSDLQIIKDYRRETMYGYESINKSMATYCKITLNFTASHTANYRLTFGIDLDVKNYTHKESSWNYTISYQNYTVFFDWTDIKNIPNLTITHGITAVGDESWFWFRIRKDNIQQGTHIIIDPGFGYSTKGSSGWGNTNTISANLVSCPGAGTATSITAYYYSSTQAEKIKFALYDSNKNLLSETEEWTSTYPFDGWKTLNLVTPQSVSATNYVLCVWQESKSPSGNFYYDSSGSNQWASQSLTYGNYPNPGGWGSYAGYIFSIYCNYTTGGQTYNIVTSFSSPLSWTLSRNVQMHITLGMTETFSWTLNLQAVYHILTNFSTPPTWNIILQTSFHILTSFTSNPTWTFLTQTTYTIVTSFATSTSWLLNIAQGIMYIVTLSWETPLTWTLSLIQTAVSPYATRGFVLATIILLAFICVPLLTVLWVKKK